MLPTAPPHTRRFLGTLQYQLSKPSQQSYYPPLSDEGTKAWRGHLALSLPPDSSLAVQFALDLGFPGYTTVFLIPGIPALLVPFAKSSCSQILKSPQNHPECRLNYRVPPSQFLIQ